MFKKLCLMLAFLFVFAPSVAFAQKGDFDYNQRAEYRRYDELPAGAVVAGDFDKNKLDLDFDNDLFFYHPLMNPGDVYETEIKIKNKYDKDMEFRFVSIVNRLKDNTMYKHMNLTLWFDGKRIYSGKLSETKPDIIPWFTLKGGEEKILKIELEFPGEESGNEFQGLEMMTTWLFEARLDEAPKEKEKPKDDEVYKLIKKEKEKKTEEIDKGKSGMSGKAGVKDEYSQGDDPNEKAVEKKSMALPIAGLVIVVGAVAFAMFKKKRR